MAPDRRRLVALASVLVLVAAFGLYRLWTGEEQPAASAAPQAARGVPRGRGAPATVSAPDVRLHALEAERPAPDGDPHRDLFRFRVKRAPESPRVQAPVVAPSPRADASGPAQPAPVPAIALRFIGLVEGSEQSTRIAILSDGRGIYQGREGDIIEGRYRILRIGVESVDMAYLDGRGRQTIRLSGS